MMPVDGMNRFVRFHIEELAQSVSTAAICASGNAAPTT
jgi:hypothetical protein